MKWDAGLMRYDPEASNDGLLVARFQTVRPSGWYCYGCGKTFKESSKTTLEEVKDEG
jgi:transposase-like protein